MTATTECFYNPANQCGNQFTGASAPAGWKEFVCDGCGNKLWACPACAATEDCDPLSCSACRIPPPIDSPRSPPIRPTLTHGVIDVGWLDGDTDKPGDSGGPSPDDPGTTNEPPPTNDPPTTPSADPPADND